LSGVDLLFEEGVHLIARANGVELKSPGRHRPPIVRDRV